MLQVTFEIPMRPLHITLLLNSIDRYHTLTNIQLVNIKLKVLLLLPALDNNLRFVTYQTERHPRRLEGVPELLTQLLKKLLALQIIEFFELVVCEPERLFKSARVENGYGLSKIIFGETRVYNINCF